MKLLTLGYSVVVMMACLAPFGAAAQSENILPSVCTMDALKKITTTLVDDGGCGEDPVERQISRQLDRLDSGNNISAAAPETWVIGGNSAGSRALLTELCSQVADIQVSNPDLVENLRILWVPDGYAWESMESSFSGHEYGTIRCPAASVGQSDASLSTKELTQLCFGRNHNAGPVAYFFDPKVLP